MSEVIYVVVAGPSYGHGPPRKAFTSRPEAKEYAEQYPEGDWTDVTEVVLVQSERL